MTVTVTGLQEDEEDEDEVPTAATETLLDGVEVVELEELVYLEEELYWVAAAETLLYDVVLVVELEDELV